MSSASLGRKKLTTKGKTRELQRKKDFLNHCRKYLKAIQSVSFMEFITQRALKCVFDFDLLKKTQLEFHFRNNS